MATPSPLQTAHEKYLADPSPDNLNEVVGELGPVIHHALNSIGVADDPLYKAKAKVLAADAVKKYDPSAPAALHTWVSRSMMPLRRFKRLKSNPIHVPEKIQLDALHLMRCERELQDKHGREPDLEELADHSKFSIKRIAKIRNTFRAMPSEGAFGEAGAPVDSEVDHTPEALDYVYKDADLIDRKILELKTGYGGNNDPLPPAEIGRLLNLTPSQLSRRSAKLALQIQQVERNLRS